LKDSSGARIVVGVLTAELALPGAQSLKDKRQVLRSIKDKLTNEFNISLAEVGYLDSWQRSTLAAAVVANEQSFADQVLAAVARKLDGNPNFFVTSLQIEFLT
jgi:uncharacterized protein